MRLPTGLRFRRTIEIFPEEHEMSIKVLDIVLYDIRSPNGVRNEVRENIRYREVSMSI